MYKNILLLVILIILASIKQLYIQETAIIPREKPADYDEILDPLLENKIANSTRYTPQAPVDTHCYQNYMLDSIQNAELDPALFVGSDVNFSMAVDIPQYEKRRIGAFCPGQVKGCRRKQLEGALPIDQEEYDRLGGIYMKFVPKYSSNSFMFGGTGDKDIAPIDKYDVIADVLPQHYGHTLGVNYTDNSMLNFGESSTPGDQQIRDHLNKDGMIRDKCDEIKSTYGSQGYEYRM
jgi:hypothetical protein